MANKNDKEPKALDQLFNQVGTYRNGKDLNELFSFIKRFPKIGPYNAFLLHVQKPGSTYVATAWEWKNKFNRTIKPGARPLVILQPFGPVRFVFDLAETTGNTPFPEELLQPFKTEGHLQEKAWKQLMANLITDGITYHEADYGVSSAGYIQRANQEIWKEAGEKNVKVLYQIITNRNHTREEKFATLAHELGHLYCGHLGSPSENWWPDRTLESKEVKEFEAESVAWLVCERMDIKNPSAQYLSGYLDEDDKIPDVSLETVLRAAGMVESRTLRKFPLRKENIQNKK
ncbi:uncharacterized protein DUF955 [Desulfobotulus alkaliphilus]|uniref:Uncharacterized protein DUF955 n=1 Tax=Desulfobotulus alkaliphilus TaxID=622671 RepID=A0A562S6G6_9BACT|nr:ImmA/IrrE family metallo-endopeptidase [Desulfobotulus alkaliphilus]TWI76937.1 uncharacterized protein DUF955 [Desulfobotulus alkaliphilus]